VFLFRLYVSLYLLACYERDHVGSKMGPKVMHNIACIALEGVRHLTWRASVEIRLYIKKKPGQGRLGDLSRRIRQRNESTHL
jgi:hypothetical protein